MSLFSGAGLGYGSFVIPEVGSYVWVFFESGDIYQPVYFAEAQTKTVGLPTERTGDYPYTKVWKTKNGIVITINDTEDSEDIKITHPNGASIQIDKTGAILIIAGGNVTVTGDVTVTGAVVVSKDITGNNFISTGLPGVDFNTHIHAGVNGDTGVPK
jgi:uncharacterized protein involved in type VI secretion and phage assembly